MSEGSKGVYVMVTTDKRGVFGGWLPAFPESTPAEVELAEARNCVRWSSDMHGVFGLAVMGPGPGCRIGPAVPRLKLAGVTSIALCTPEAAARWESGAWS